MWNKKMTKVTKIAKQAIKENMATDFCKMNGPSDTFCGIVNWIIISVTNVMTSVFPSISKSTSDGTHTHSCVNVLVNKLCGIHRLLCFVSQHD